MLVPDTTTDGSPGPMASTDDHAIVSGHANYSNLPRAVKFFG